MIGADSIQEKFMKRKKIFIKKSEGEKKRRQKTLRVESSDRRRDLSESSYVIRKA